MNNEEEEEVEELKVLMDDIEGWAIVRWTDYDYSVVYAEHVEGCDKPFNGEAANWCWEHGDVMPGKDNLCWMCRKLVPSSVVGLVAMANWHDRGNFYGCKE